MASAVAYGPGGHPAPKYVPRNVSARIAPAPIASGVSVRKLPTASIEEIAKTCEHWLAKSRGDYGHPATRHMFEMGHELTALIEPLRAEEARKNARLHHLEQMLAQWNEVFGGPGDGDLASPLTLAEALRKYKAVTASLGQQLEAAHAETAAHVVRCKEVLAQHHAAWAADREREAMRHAEEVARLRDLHARTLRHLELQAPAVYGRAAEEAEEAAIRAARQQHRF